MTDQTPKKIITYGLRYQDFDRQRDLFAMRNNGEIDIVAEIAYAPEDPEIFGKRMSVEEGLKCDRDLIIDCDGQCELEVEHNDLSVLTGPHYESIHHVQIGILKELVDATDEEIHDEEWLRGRLNRFGFYPFFKLVKEPREGVTWTKAGALQVPDEFYSLCRFLLDKEYEDAIEIGVAGGASSYILAAILYRNNHAMKYHMVDIADGLAGFDEVKMIIPSLVKDIPKTSDGFTGQSFDFCFIDADHSYDGMIRDWENVGKNSRGLTVFHDIFGHEYDELNGGTVRGWREIRSTVGSSRVKEFSVYPDRWMGIGIVEF